MIVDGQNGFLIEPKKPQQLAEKISYLLQDPEICSNLSKNAQIAVREKFSLDKMLEKTKKIYYSF